mmetsp:Transcript_21200/g.59679  ORF Transcript_21200/g.59679 Transcript_21200/m.59679 type:complete len:138 (+) Transcript_21200:44-457(+)|eukprot:CAMPEP_0119121156 /NCGR_PEP_ID=MMETSP1310-20130426/1912_1 /TAXON_ID=464262 /ORGANISM="Genus nov. species nov., Strain RCC2339" /LENGTH=137 /DNA_ID=CAMNT_0007110701 /DNA_START=44 /DNA_END=457 /DNA_ORIENTATION=-
MAQGLSSAQEEEYRIAFQFFDKENTGTLNKDGAQMLLRSIGEDPNEHAQLCNGHLDVNTFIQNRREKWMQAQSLAEVKQAFSVFDKQRNGRIPGDSLKYYLTSLGDTLTEQEANDLIKEAGGDVDYNSFAETMLKAN